MKRPVFTCVPPPAGYTLVEILVATTLALMLLGAVITMFGRVGESITDARAMLEAADRLRLAETRLQQDLAGITVTVNPPRKPESNEGYFEYIEGPVTQATAPSVAVNTDNSSNPDPTVGDFDDILMFTTRSTGRPFVGKCASAAGGTIQSDVAEVAWFLRGRTLHRRVLLVAPNATLAVPAGQSYYNANDISARLQGTAFIPNTLSDLTRRECRFAHNVSGFPYPANWIWTASGSSCQFPTLPTLAECSYPTWPLNRTPVTFTPAISLDFWINAATSRLPDNAAVSPNTGPRIADDIILTNVIGFDVTAYDPVVVVQATTVATGVTAYFFPSDAGYSAALGNVGNTVSGIAYSLVSPYRNLGFAGANYAAGNAKSVGHLGDSRSVLNAATTNVARVYDTWSTTYDGSTASNGLDDNNNGIVDDDLEKLAAPPYPVPLRGIQVKIRTFEPDSRQIREVTVVQEFLPQ